MLESLKTYFRFGNTSIGIEHTNSKIHVTKINHIKGEFEIEDFSSYTKIKELKNKELKKFPIHLSINTDKVLFKQIESNQKEERQLIAKAYPNIDLSNFYFDIISSDKIHFIFISRKAEIEHIIELYEAEGIPIQGISIGNSLLKILPKLVAVLNFYTSNSEFSILQGKLAEVKMIQHIQTKEKEIQGHILSNFSLLSFLAALQVYAGIADEGNLTEKNNSLKNEFYQQRFSHLFIPSAISFIFIILLLNFLFFNIYYNDVQKLEETSSINQSAKQKLQALTLEVNKKEKLVQNVINNSSSNSSYFVNTIIQKLPSTIILKKLEYQPLQRNIKEDDIIQLLKKQIEIEGNSNNKNNFSDWVNELEKIEWVNKVSITNYSDESTSSTSNFSLKIFMNDK